MPKEYDSDTKEKEFLKETLYILKKMQKRYPEVKELSQILLLMGGDTIVFDGWGEIKDMAELVRVGRIVEVEDVSMDIVREGKYDCMLGLCWCNTAEIVSDNPHFIPVYAFALSEYYKRIGYWMEHFIMKDTRTGKYYEATDINDVTKYFAMDISKNKLMDMEREYFDYDIDE
jgi:hypothetical protein